jgi:hypothetical protein
VVFFGFQLAIAGDTTPPPPPDAPLTPGLPIDGSLVVLFFIALVTGYYLSKKYISTKKGSL